MKNSFFHLLIIGITLTILSGCESSNPNWEQEANNPDFLHHSLKEITDVIVHDIFSPPVASRIYAYSTISAYEALVPDHPEYNSLVGQLNGLESVPQPEAGKTYCYPLAATKAMLRTGKALIFSEDKIDAFEAELMKEFQAINMPKDVYDRSIAYGEEVSKAILGWADKDNYKQTRTSRNIPSMTIRPGGNRPRPIIWMPLNPTGTRSGPLRWIHRVNSYHHLLHLST